MSSLEATIPLRVCGNPGLQMQCEISIQVRGMQNVVDHQILRARGSYVKAASEIFPVILVLVLGRYDCSSMYLTRLEVFARDTLNILI